MTHPPQMLLVAAPRLLLVSMSCLLARAMLEQLTHLPHNVRVYLCVSLATKGASENADALLRAVCEKQESVQNRCQTP